MKKRIVSFLLIFSLFQGLNAQTKDGVVSFDVPAKNSLKFNRYLFNPAFSYIREDESFVSFLNKRQWMGFDEAPISYFFSYSGKFREQNGIAFGAFQRNVGVLTTFGAIANFARNVELNNDSNFTFGLNLAYVSSGLNTGKVITNETDASLQNVPKNSLVSVNPGINYSTGLIDLGLTANNIFFYNFTNSESVQDDPAKSIAAHAMYTGYYDGYGMFENSKFSALIRGDIGKEKTIFSGSLLFNAPKAGWAQAGYNSVYGASAGIGLILAKKISIGYTVEKGFGNFSDFGLSHEVTLAYKIRGYGAYEDEKPIVRATKKTNPGQESKAVAVKKKTPAELKAEREAALALKLQQDKERLEAERLRREAAIAQAKAKAEEAARLKAEREKELAQKGQQSAEARAKAEAEARLKAEQDKAKALADAERLRNEKLAADAKAKADAAARLKEEQERLAREKAEADRLAKEKIAADAQAKTEAAARLKAEADRLAKEKADAAKAEADRIAREKAEADRIAKEQAAAEAKAKAEEAARLKAEQDRLAKEKADAAKAEADRIAREKAEADRLAKEKVEADRIAKEQAEADRIAREKAEADAKAKEEAERLRKEAEEKARIDALKTAEDKELDNLAGVIEDSKKIQTQSINKFKTLVSDKEKELLELRKANDDSDKGIVTQTKEVEFQSGAAANRAIEALKTDIKENLKQQDQFIKEYETLAAERLKKIPNKNDLVNLNYTKTIEKLKLDRALSEKQSDELIAKLEQIKVDTEVEKKRRIKRALFDSTQDKYQKDRAALSQIKATTTPTGQVYQPTDFDYGDSEQTNMQIVKNVDNIKPGFYLVVASHKDEARRDAFIKKAIQAGQTNIDFFYDVNTSTYHIYYQQFDEIGDADNAMKTKGSKPFNGKMVILKVEK